MQSFIEACTRAYSFEGFAVHGYLIFVRSSHELYYRHSLIYYAVPYTYISLDSFAAQEINRRARATSNDRLCRDECVPAKYIYILHVYIHTHTPLVHVEARSFMVSLSTFCFMLAFAWTPTARVFQPKIHHVHTVSTAPVNALIPTRPMQSWCPVRSCDVDPIL